METIYIIIIMILLGGAYFGIKGTKDLLKFGKKSRNILIPAAIFLVVVPIIVNIGFSLVSQTDDPSVWLIYPLLFLGFAWICLGYFIGSIAKKAVANNEIKRTAEHNKKRLTTGAISLVVGVIIWFYGYFHGFATTEDWWLALSLVGIIQGANMLIKYR